MIKSAKVSGPLLLCELSDPCVVGASIDLKSGNWKVSYAVREAVSNLGPMDRMVQLFEIRSLLEINASYAQVFTVILSRCQLGHSANSIKSTQMAHLFKTILLST